MHAVCDSVCRTCSKPLESSNTLQINHQMMENRSRESGRWKGKLVSQAVAVWQFISKKHQLVLFRRITYRSHNKVGQSFFWKKIQFLMHCKGKNMAVRLYYSHKEYSWENVGERNYQWIYDRLSSWTRKYEEKCWIKTMYYRIQNKQINGGKCTTCSPNH